MPPPGETEQQVIQWNDAVRKSGVVSVFVGSGMRASRWVGIVDKAIGELNRELRHHSIPVVIMKTAKQADALVSLETIPLSDLHGQTFLDMGGTPYLQKVVTKIPRDTSRQ